MARAEQAALEVLSPHDRRYGEPGDDVHWAIAGCRPARRAVSPRPPRRLAVWPFLPVIEPLGTPFVIRGRVECRLEVAWVGILHGVTAGHPGRGHLQSGVEPQPAGAARELLGVEPHHAEREDYVSWLGIILKFDAVIPGDHPV